MSKNNQRLEEQIKQDRFRNFNILLYKDTTSYKYSDVIFKLNEYKYYAYIEHKPETDEKKEHTHLFIHLDNACTLSAVANNLGIPKNFVQETKSVRSSCRYLTHIDYPDKIQYDYKDVHISTLFERKFKKNFEDLETEEQIINNIFEFIDNLHFDYTYNYAMRVLIQWVNLNVYDTIFKRYRTEFLDYLKSTY